MSYRGRMLPRVLAVSLLALTVGCGSSATVVSTQCLPTNGESQKGPKLVLIYSDGTMQFALIGKPERTVACYTPYPRGFTLDDIGSENQGR